MLLDIEPSIAERSAGLGLAPGERLRKITAFPHDSHAAAAAARDRLDHRGAAVERVEEREGLVDGSRMRRAPQNGDPRTCRDGTSLGFVTERGEGDRRRTDEHETLLRARLRESGLLAQEPVSGMHSGAPRAHRRVEDLLDVEVRGGAASTQRDSDVSAAWGQRVRVVLGVHRDGADPEVGGGSDHPEGDLSPIGDEDTSPGVELAAHARALRRW